MCGADIFLGLLAILFPPLPVWVKRGLCSADSLLNILLCVLGYIPGLLHAWYVIARYPEDEAGYYYEGLPEHNESGHVTYVFVQPASGGQPRPQPQRQQQQQSKSQHQHQGGLNYGTTTTTTAAAAAASSSAPAPAPAPQEENGGEGGSNGSANLPPPTYAEAVKGDHKVQTQD